MNIDNCPRCGKLYTKNFREFCPACIKEIDQEYSLCAEYLRKNKGATTHELSDATTVSVKQITKFIREGRISMINAPNLAYPCEACGIPIREKNICNNCRSRFAHEVNMTMNAGSLKRNRKNPNGPGYQIGERLRDRLD